MNQLPFKVVLDLPAHKREMVPPVSSTFCSICASSGNVVSKKM